MGTYIELNRNFYPIKNTEKDLEEAKIMSAFGHDSYISWEELLQKPRVVILAEPGTGKTEELKAVTNRLRSKGATAFFCRIELLEDFEIRGALDIGTNDEFNSWLNGEQEGYFFLDSVDEAHLKGRLTFENALRRFAEKINEHRERIKVFVTCRVSDWRTTTDLQSFQNLLPVPPSNKLKKGDTSKGGIQFEGEPGKDNERGDIVFQLLPLNNFQIAHFAEEKGIKNIKAFMEAIDRENVTMFAKRPQDLLDLILYWNSYGCFGRHAEMVEFNIRQKLKENDSDRDICRPLSSEDALIGAERLAAAITLQKKNIIILPDKYDGDLVRREASIDSKEVLADWSPDKIKTLLDRPIFDVAIYGTVQFHHRVIREYLSARWFKRLIERGKSRRSIEKYFFTDKYGQDVVIPSMRPIVAWLSLWDEQIRSQVTRLAPEILIEYGDPSSLPLEFKKLLLIGFTEHYAERQHTGISLNIDMLRRLADPQLSTTVNELLDKFLNHIDISRMLLIMIWQGKMSESVEKALSFAIDNKQADLYSRIWAIRAIATVGSPEKQQILIDKLMDDISKLDSNILAEICECFFPNTLSVNQLLKIVESLKSSKEDCNNPLEQSIEKIADTSLSDEIVKEILQGFYTLLKQPPFTPEPYCEISISYVWLLPIAVKLANKLIVKKDTFSLQTLILNLFLGFINLSDYHFYLTKHKKTELLEVAKAWSEFKFELLWRAATVIRAATKKENNIKITSWSQVSWYIKNFWIPNIDDLNRLFKALTEKPLIDDRLVALSAIIYIYIETKRQRKLLHRIKQAIKDNLQLEKVLKEYLNQNSLTNELKIKLRSYFSKGKIEKSNQRQNAIDLKLKKEFMKKPEEIRNVGNAEKKEVWERTVYLYNRIPEKKNSGRLGLSNWKSLIKDYNHEVAKNFRDGCIAYWRKYDPFSDERAVSFLRGTNNIIPWSLIIGLTGLAIEAIEEPEFIKQLSIEEAEIAAHYSICELNGFPSWLKSLSDAFPEIVGKVIIDELRWELQKESANINSSRILLALTYNDLKLGERYKTILVDLLCEKEPINDEAIENTLSIILKGELDASLREKATKLAYKYFEISSEENHQIKWLKLIFYIDGLKGLELIKQRIASSPSIEEKKSFMIKFCANLVDYEVHFSRGINRDFERVEILSEFVPLIFQYIKPEEDNSHTGTYTPDIRDKAEEARSRLFNIVADTPGLISYKTLVNLSTIENNGYFRDHMDYLAKKRAALDAEFEPWTGNSIIKFEDITVKIEKHKPQDYIHLLHLSDLHFTEDVSPEVKLQWLVQDIRYGDCLGFNKIEYLVISGDFTDKGNEVGFNQARQFISLLMREFNISMECCILVPGNHDINYSMFPNCLESFSKMFNNITNNSYSSEPDKQAQSYLNPKDYIQFITLNSGWQIDQSNPKKASINLNALAYVLDTAEKERQDAINREELDKNQKLLRIAVFHHPVIQFETMRAQNFIEHLRQSHIQLIFHGDIHEINREIYKIWEDNNIQIIGAGSFGKVDDRPDCTPRLYNLLEIKRDLSLIRIHTRQQCIIDGPWEGWYGWPDPSSSDARLSYFDITL